ncbi:DEAD/DEAH box helicase, partial [Streptococcus pyogenes]
TAKFDLEKIAEDLETIDLTDQTLDNIQHCYLMVDKRDRIDLLRKFSNIPDFRALTFFNSLSDLGASEDKLTYNQSNVVSLASD